jgi:hypothetical protein
MTRMLRRSAGIALGLVMLLAACGSAGGSQSSSTTIDSTARAETMMTQACLQFAQTWLTTDPKNGLARLTLQQGIAGINAAAAKAQGAATLDRRWAEGQSALQQLAQGLTRTNSPEVASALSHVERVCTPLIHKFETETTTTAP